jgi:molybdate transport system ATP-binding protein
MRNVTIRYGNKVIIDKLNWKILPGERWALTGRNGSGKTTLFSMIYADHPMAYSEHVFLFGKRRGSGESIWDIKKRISYLGPEQLHFLDYATSNLTVLEYLEKVKAPEKKLNQLITQFQIEALLVRQLQYLSNGQLQLVLLVSLFLAPKELLLLDEPFQFLDPQQKERVTAYLHSFLEESTTLVLITHYEDDVNQWTHHRLSL